MSNPKAQYDLVSGLKEKELFPDLKFPLQYSNNCCVLLNDENHSYQDVIRLLEKVMPKVTPKLASDLMTYVDKFGKGIIHVGSYQECDKMSNKVSLLTRERVSNEYRDFQSVSSNFISACDNIENKSCSFLHSCPSRIFLKIAQLDSNFV